MPAPAGPPVTRPLRQGEAPADGAVHPFSPVRRLESLCDPGTLRPLSPPDSSGVVAARGTVDGTPAIAYCTDATTMGGAMGAAGCEHIVDAIRTAVAERLPVVGIWHSGGARLADGVESMDGVGRVFRAMTEASGRVPQLSVVLGPAAGAAAYGPALTDLVVMSGQGRMFVTGPDIVKAVTGQPTTMEELGGTGAHARLSGVCHVSTGSEEDAVEAGRRITGLLGRPGRPHPDRVADTADLRALLPARPREAYDVHPLVDALLDGDDGFVELQPKWAPNVVIGLGRLGGRTVGVVANNPIRKGGCLDSLSAEKAARFVQMCSSLGVPLLVLVDVPGYLPGLEQEHGGVIRRGAKLLHAFANCRVPRITVITRKSYGGAYIAMNSRSLGATAVFAWPGAEVAVMGAEAAVGLLHRRKLAEASEAERPELMSRLLAEHAERSGGVRRAVELGVVDAVIAPATTRRRVAEALAEAADSRGAHTNIPL